MQWFRGIWLLVSAITLSLSATASVSFHAAYVDVGPGGSAAALAADSAGNHFVVSQVTDVWGIPRLRATKTNAQGQTLAKLDFGSTLASPHAAAVDGQGNLVVAGDTSSPQFPAGSPGSNGEFAFVVKLDGSLTQVLAVKIVGGGPPVSGASATAVTTDAAGNIYVTGSTGATDFPVTAGAFQTKPPAMNNFGNPVYAYLDKLSPDLKEVLFGTYFGEDTTACFGGSSCIGKVGVTGASAIALDGSGDIVIAGITNAATLPVTAGSYAGTCGCSANVAAGFITKFSSDGSRLVWSTFLPPPTIRAFLQNLGIRALALDTAGDVVLAGSTPNGFPVTAGALQTTYPAPPLAGQGVPYAGFVAKFDSGGASLLAATYFGGGVGGGVFAVAVDSANAIWITGQSDTDSLPGAPAALGTAFVANLSPDLGAVTVLETAPAGAAGVAIAAGPSGVGVLGSQGSLLISDPSGAPGVVAVANAAGTMASGAIAPAELLSFYGYNLGPASALTLQIANGVVSSALNGYQVVFNGVAAPLLYVGLNQVNCVVPVEIQRHDTVAVQIVTPQGTVPGPNLLVSAAQPEVFKDAQGFALALNQDQTVNSASNPAALGSIVSIWASGGGPDYAGLPDGTILPNRPNQGLMLPVSVLAASSQEVLYAGDAPGGVTGLVQVNFRLPASVFLGATRIGLHLQVGVNTDHGFAIYVHP